MFRSRLALAAHAAVGLAFMASGAFAQIPGIDPFECEGDCSDEECITEWLDALTLASALPGGEGPAACAINELYNGRICLAHPTESVSRLARTRHNYSTFPDEMWYWESSYPNCIELNSLAISNAGPCSTTSDDPLAAQIIAAAAIIHEVCHAKYFDGCLDPSTNQWQDQQAFCQNEVACHEVEKNVLLAAAQAHGGSLTTQGMIDLIDRFAAVESSQAGYASCQ